MALSDFPQTGTIQCCDDDNVIDHPLPSANPLEPIEKQLRGYVGLPLPSVEAKIIDKDTGDVIYNKMNLNAPPKSSELCVRGPADHHLQILAKAVRHN